MNVSRGFAVVFCGMVLGVKGPVVVAERAALRGTTASPRTTLSLDALAVPAGSPVVVDGNLDEALWGTAPRIENFLQREPHEGAPASHATQVQVAFDSTSTRTCLVCPGSRCSHWWSTKVR